MALMLYVVAGGCTLLWAILAGRALFADRSRRGGTRLRRCPRCFYDLADAAPGPCPECGRQITPTTNLHRTRRHWWRFAAAGLLLLPAASLAGIARVRQTGGWADLPAWLTTRLIALDEQAILDDTGKRARADTIHPKDLERAVVFAAQRLGDADANRRKWSLRLLRNVAFRDRAWASAVRPLLGPYLREIRPDVVVPALLAAAGDNTLTEGVYDLFGALCCEDERVLFALLAALNDPDTSAVGAATFGLAWLSEPIGGQRRPALPEESLGLNLDTPSDGLLEFAAEVTTRAADRDALLAWLRESVLTRDRTQRDVFLMPGVPRPRAGPPPDEALRPMLSLWLWLAMEPGDPEARGAVFEFAQSGLSVQRREVGRLLLGREWDAEVENAYRTLVADEVQHVRQGTIEALRSFGRSAKPLVPDLLALARSDSGGCPASTFTAIGGEPRELLDATLSKLERLWPDRERRVVPGNSGNLQGNQHPVWILQDLANIAELGIVDPDAAALVEKWMTFRSPPSVPLPPPLARLGITNDTVAMSAARASARLGGDKAKATRLVLDLQPRFELRPVGLSVQLTMMDMIASDTADHAQVLTYLRGPPPEPLPVDPNQAAVNEALGDQAGDPSAPPPTEAQRRAQQLAGFFNAALFQSVFDRPHMQPYAELARECLKSDDAALVDAAQQALQRLEPRPGSAAAAPK